MTSELLNRRTTGDLEDKLVQIRKESDLEQFIEAPLTLVPYECFTDYYFSLDKVRNTQLSDIIRRSGIERTYAYQILNGRKKNPGRDKIIRLCIGAGLTVKETVRALEAGSESILYARKKRDILIAYCINSGYTAEETDLLLDSYDEQPLQ